MVFMMKFYENSEIQQFGNISSMYLPFYRQRELLIKKLEELDRKKDVEITLLKAAIEHMKAEIEKLKAELEKHKLIPSSKGGAKRPVTSKK